MDSRAGPRFPTRMSRLRIYRPIWNWMIAHRSLKRPRTRCLPTTKMTALPPRRDWLETLRAQVIGSGTEVPRPVPGDGAPDEKITRWLIRINALTEKLTAGVPDDPQERTREQQARWILANVLDFHRRNEKAVWWELFRLADLSAEDLLEEPAGLSGLTFGEAVGGTEKAPVDRYGFPPQETALRGG